MAERGKHGVERPQCYPHGVSLKPVSVSRQNPYQSCACCIEPTMGRAYQREAVAMESKETQTVRSIQITWCLLAFHHVLRSVFMQRGYLCLIVPF